jgi:hypothetical protein
MTGKIREPAVSRQTLIRISALLWSLVGGMLLVRAFLLLGTVSPFEYLLLGAGLLVGVVKGKLVMIPLARHNLKRVYSLSPQKDKICLFAFQANFSYLVVSSSGRKFRLLPPPQQTAGIP